MRPTIVVPLPDPLLDPERVGEWAVPYARALAKRRDAPVVLVSVVELPVDPGVRTPGGAPAAEREQRRRLGAARQAYLAGVSQRFPGGATRADARFGNVVAEVLSTAAAVEDPILVLARQERRGIDQLFIGRVAPRLVREAPGPVLLVRAPAPAGVDLPQLTRVIVPLDGSAAAEQAIDVVRDILGGDGLHVCLLHVLSPLATRPGSEQGRTAMERYLHDQAPRIAEGGGQVTVEVRTGEPGTEIPRAAAAWGADLIALTPHGRGGFKRLLLGSVAEGLIHREGPPLLVARSRVLAPA